MFGLSLVTVEAKSQILTTRQPLHLSQTRSDITKVSQLTIRKHLVFGLNGENLTGKLEAGILLPRLNNPKLEKENSLGHTILKVQSL